jgi:hypothetical protein
MGFLDFLSGVGNVFGQLASITSEIFSFLWQIMAQLFSFLWDTQVAVYNWNFSTFLSVGKFFRNIWTNYIKIGLLWVMKEIGKLWSFLHRILDPILKWLQKIRKWYDTHILPMLLKELQLIQRIRQFLALLRIFHVKWAQALDDKLLSMQGKITTSIEAVRGYLNMIISWISLVTDPSMIIRRNTLGAWLLSHLGGLKRIVGYGGNRPLTASEQAMLDHEAVRFRPDTMKAHREYVLANGLTDEEKYVRAANRAAIEEATGQPLPF